jgi:hypothetical protein
MIVPLAVPRTRTFSPVLMAAAAVEDVSLTVTFWPFAVDMVKPDVDTVLTVPVAPPAAGPERALDPAPPDRGPPSALLSKDGCAAVAKGEAATVMDSPITAHSSTAATIQPLILFDSSRYSRDRRVSSATGGSGTVWGSVGL